jgi:hypothetical protein
MEASKMLTVRLPNDTEASPEVKIAPTGIGADKAPQAAAFRRGEHPRNPYGNMIPHINGIVFQRFFVD